MNIGLSGQTRSAEEPDSHDLVRRIAAVLRDYGVCREIARCFVENQGMMDTARGIATFWVDRDELEVQSALDHLIACGAVTAHTRHSGTLYALTHAPEIRAWLCTQVQGLLPAKPFPQG
jgi:hypothetical protein